MEDLIRRSDAINIIEKNSYYIGGRGAKLKIAIAEIKALPSADIDLSEYSDKLWKNAYERGKADRPQGEWIETDMRCYGATVYKCSVCDDDVDEMPTVMGVPKYRYCPNCGARMIRKLDAKIVVNGNCALCGKPLSDGRLFVCKECEEHIEEGADDEMR